MYGLQEKIAEYTSDLKKEYKQFQTTLPVILKKVIQHKFAVKIMEDSRFILEPPPPGITYSISINKKLQINFTFYMKAFLSEKPAPWYSLQKVVPSFSDRMVYRFHFVMGELTQFSLSVPPAQTELYDLSAKLYLACRDVLDEESRSQQKKQEEKYFLQMKRQKKTLENILKRIV